MKIIMLYYKDDDAPEEPALADAMYRAHGLESAGENLGKLERYIEKHP